MGLIHNLLVSVTHLLFVGMDILVVMILVKVVYDRWQFLWLKPFFDLVCPSVKFITSTLGARLSRITGKSYPEKTQAILLVLFLWAIQFVFASTSN